MNQQQVSPIVPISEKTHPIGSGTQRLYRFDNGYGASVVQFTIGSGAGSYGADAGLWELGVIVWTGANFNLTYETPITDDVLGWLSEEDVQRLLHQIRDLPNREAP